MSEEKETIINGIDVSEEIRYCNNCSNLGLDFKARKFYCSLSHRPDELPEVLSCNEFSTNCYIKRLQEENKELKEQEQEYVNFRVALGDIKNIIEFRFKTAYMTLGLKETDKIIEDIEKIVNEVLNEN